jgi:hypothetical protein
MSPRRRWATRLKDAARRRFGSHIRRFQVPSGRSSNARHLFERTSPILRGGSQRLRILPDSSQPFSHRQARQTKPAATASPQGNWRTRGRRGNAWREQFGTAVGCDHSMSNHKNIVDEHLASGSTISGCLHRPSGPTRSKRLSRFPIPPRLLRENGAGRRI